MKWRDSPYSSSTQVGVKKVSMGHKENFLLLKCHPSLTEGSPFRFLYVQVQKVNNISKKSCQKMLEDFRERGGGVPWYSYVKEVPEGPQMSKR